MTLSKKNINLLPQSDFEKGPIGKFIKWSLHWGKHIIIFTELIVIASFIYRFKLDRDLVNQKDDLQQKLQEIESYAALEKEIRFLHKRLDFIYQTDTERLKPDLVINELIKITPPDIVYSDLSIKEDLINIKGISYSNIGLNAFINNLKNNSIFSTINISSIKSKGQQDPTLEFELSASLKESG